MVDMVELGESGCYEVKSVFRCLMAEWWRWLSSEREWSCFMAIWWIWLNSWREELSGNVCFEVLPCWMVDMVELRVSGC